MSVIGEVVGIVACVAGVISAYHDGGAIIQKIKVKRALRKAPAPPRFLEDSIDQAPEEIEKEKRIGISRLGRAFEDGDHIAVIALQSITIQLQGTLLEKLRNDENEQIEFMDIADAADAGRIKTITALFELRQRLLSALPIIELPPPKSTEPLQIQAGPQPTDIPLRLSRQISPSLAPPQQQRTWSRDHGTSREASGEENAIPGADESAHGRRKRHGSLLGLFKHRRSQPESKEDIPKVDRTLHSALSPTGTPRVISPVAVGAREQTPASQPGFQYQDWEDDPAQIWGAKQDSERRGTVVVGSPEDGRVSPTMTNRSLSTAASHSPAQTVVHAGSGVVPTPTPENNYLGFCKSAWRLQNGDRRAMQKCKEFNDGWSQSSVYYLACSSSKCAFAGHIDPEKIWDKVWTVEAKGLKFRWLLLAKSHVPQQKVKDHQYAYQCLFCVFLSEPSPVYFGTDIYLDHVSTHRGKALSEVVLYKTKSIQGCVATDDEEFDVNLFPLETHEPPERKQSAVLSDDLLFAGPSKPGDEERDSVHSNQPWNEGLSDFHWGGEMQRAELE